jgi:hypothetical protein
LVSIPLVCTDHDTVSAAPNSRTMVWASLLGARHLGARTVALANITTSVSSMINVRILMPPILTMFSLGVRIALIAIVLTLSE